MKLPIARDSTAVRFASYLLIIMSANGLKKTWRRRGNADVKLKLRDPAEGAHAGRGRSPVAVLPVLAPLQEVLLPPVVGQVVEHPGAVGHHAGVGLAELEGVIH